MGILYQNHTVCQGKNKLLFCRPRIFRGRASSCRCSAGGPCKSCPSLPSPPLPSPPLPFPPPALPASRSARPCLFPFLFLTNRPCVLIMICAFSGCGEVWYRAWFGSKRPRVQIPALRPRGRKVRFATTFSFAFGRNERHPPAPLLSFPNRPRSAGLRSGFSLLSS